MPKMKSRSSAKKRFRANAKGQIKHRKAFTSHILTKKNRKRKRNLRRAGTVDKVANEKILRMVRV